MNPGHSVPNKIILSVVNQYSEPMIREIVHGTSSHHRVQQVLCLLIQYPERWIIQPLSATGTKKENIGDKTSRNI